jgi:hypothetical protein
VLCRGYGAVGVLAVPAKLDIVTTLCAGKVICWGIIADCPYDQLKFIAISIDLQHCAESPLINAKLFVGGQMTMVNAPYHPP